MSHLVSRQSPLLTTESLTSDRHTNEINFSPPVSSLPSHSDPTTNCSDNIIIPNSEPSHTNPLISPHHTYPQSSPRSIQPSQLIIHSSNPTQPSQPVTQPSHPMITRAKNGIFKPKQFLNMSFLCETLLESTTIADALSHPKWKQAMNSKFQALIKNDTWDIVPYIANMNVVTNKWVFRVKYKSDGSVERFKYRLVAKGFQQLAGIDFFETFSLVFKPSTIRVIFSLAVTN